MAAFSTLIAPRVVGGSAVLFDVFFRMAAIDFKWVIGEPFFVIIDGCADIIECIFGEDQAAFVIGFLHDGYKATAVNNFPFLVFAVGNDFHFLYLAFFSDGEAIGIRVFLADMYSDYFFDQIMDFLVYAVSAHVIAEEAILVHEVKGYCGGAKYTIEGIAAQ